MNLKCLGSGSSGNCYVLHNNDEALIIEAGVRIKDVKIALDFNISKVVGAIAGHCHSDHSKYISDLEKLGVPTFKPYESEMVRQVRAYGEFVIKSFPLAHDVPCFGFLVEHPDMGRLLYASDTEYIRYKFKNLNHILVEANYSPARMESTDSPKRNHVLTGHMSIDTTVEFLKANTSPALRNVVLLHLSESNSDESQFKAAAETVVDCPVYVADNGLEVELREFPF